MNNTDPNGLAARSLGSSNIWFGGSIFGTAGASSTVSNPFGASLASAPRISATSNFGSAIPSNQPPSFSSSNPLLGGELNYRSAPLSSPPINSFQSQSSRLIGSESPQYSFLRDVAELSYEQHAAPLVSGAQAGYSQVRAEFASVRAGNYGQAASQHVAFATGLESNSPINSPLMSLAFGAVGNYLDPQSAQRGATATRLRDELVMLAAGAAGRGASTTARALDTANDLASSGQVVRASLAPASVAQRTNAQLLQNIATRADVWATRQGITGTPQQLGIAKHGYARDVLNRYQDMFGPRGLQTEVSVIRGEIKNYGTAGSVRLDVLEGAVENPTAIFDYKFGASGLSRGRINQIQRIGGYPGVPVIEVRP